MTNEQLSTTPYETVYEDDPTLAPGTEKVKTTPYTGYKYRTYRNVYDADGKLISSTYEATSDYKSRNKVILRGPAVEPAGGGAQLPDGTTAPLTHHPRGAHGAPGPRCPRGARRARDAGRRLDHPDAGAGRPADSGRADRHRDHWGVRTFHGRPAPGRTLCMTARGILSLFAERGSRISGCLFALFPPGRIY